MKRFLSVAWLALMLLDACTGLPGLAKPTGTPLPTNTLSPTATFTPLPTDTPTPTPTSTPNATATAAGKATQAADEVLSELDDLLGDTDIPYKEGALLWKQNRPMKITMSGPDDEIMRIDDRVQAGDFIFKSDVTWDATGLLLCGAVFRSEPNLLKGKQYQFVFMRFSGLPGWAIEVHEGGRYRNSPTKAKFSDALDLDNGDTNQFVLVVQDDHFTLYLNYVRQGTYYDFGKQRTDGSFGFMGWQQSGKGSCEYENSWIWTLDTD